MNADMLSHRLKCFTIGQEGHFTSIILLHFLSVFKPLYRRFWSSVLHTTFQHHALTDTTLRKYFGFPYPLRIERTATSPMGTLMLGALEAATGVEALFCN